MTENGRLAVWQIALLVGYAAAMAGGQGLFKAAALRFPADGSWTGRLLGLAQNAYFLSAIAIYLVLTVLWVWVLTVVPLSRAYPFVALAFALTPLVGLLVFGEPADTKLLVGIGLVLCGLLLVAA